MLDQNSPEQTLDTEQTTETFDLVVVGAGVAGLNALYSATEYLPKGAKVLLIDEKQDAGGMWNTAYDYVRLHQPHPMFTVGDMRWDWSQPRDYLARRDEVRDHLASSLAEVSKKVDLKTAFGHTVTDLSEIETGDGHRARVTFQPTEGDKKPRTVLAHRAIHASGLNYHLAEPLALSSSNVVSIIPQDLQEALSTHPGTPLIVVGGGKTGMDTILAALAQNPMRSITLVNGPGTNFLNRTKYIPTGIRRWTSGELVSRLFRDLALHFDGDNEEHTISYFRKTHSTDTESDNGVFLYGLQSEEELAQIKAGLSKTHNGYLADISDGETGPVLTLRDGTSTEVEPGSIVVNCTGSFFRAPDMADTLPCLSPHKTVVSINARDGFHFLTSVSGFFFIHLLYRGELTGKGFYRLDHEALFRQNRNAWVGASAAQAYMNQVIAVQTLPMMLLDRCGLDLDRWYPLPRRMAGLMRMKSTATQDIAHCRAALDRVADRFGVRCGPID